jgi:uncharacterized protein YkwD
MTAMKKSYRPNVEALEARWMPSTAKLVGGTLLVNGTPKSDFINVSLTGPFITVSGVKKVFLAGAVNQVAVNAGAGNDLVIIDSKLTKPAFVNAGAGNDIVLGGGGDDTLLGGGGFDLMVGGGGRNVINGVPDAPPAASGFGLNLTGPGAPATPGTPPASPGAPIVSPAINLSAQEQLLLELSNRGRANPLAEASRYGISLNEGLSAGTISGAAKQPLAPNAALLQAARAHSDDMLLNDYFAHPSLNGTTPEQRDSAAGYGGFTGENIGWTGTTGSLNATQAVLDIYRNLFVDSNVAGRGHRTNLMNPDSSEVGPAARPGQFTKQGTTYNAEMVTQDFGDRGLAFLTGVMYQDANSNHFYDVGEGLAGGTVEARNQATGQVYRTTTGTAGGYALALPPGSYLVSLSSPTITGNGTSSQSSGLQIVTIGQDNVKADLVM